MTEPLPFWIQRLFGIRTGPGEGTSWSIEHTWSWPAWLALLFIVGVVVFVLFNYRRDNPHAPRWLRLVLAGIRLALVGLVLFMLAQMVLVLHRTGLPYAVVLVDDSLSMTIVDRYDAETSRRMAPRLEAAGQHEASRWNLARTLLTERNGALLAGMRRRYKLRVCRVSDGRPLASTGPEAVIAELAALEPKGESTRLGAAVRGVLDDLRGAPPAAIVLLTDGINTEGPPLAEVAEQAARKGVPLFTVGLGDRRGVRDVKLTDLLVDDVVFVDDVVPFECRLSATGLEGREVDVVLRRLDLPDELARQHVTLEADGQTQTVRIPYRPTEEGRFRFAVEIPPLEDELQTDNNRLERTVEVRKAKIRVLLAAAYPSYEFRYLRNMLNRDETIQLETVLQEADLEYAQQDAAALAGFPVRREELLKYDVIILGDLNPALLSRAMLENLAFFVDRPGGGGALICIAGPKYMPAAYRDTPLARLLPIDPSAVRYPVPGQPLTEGFHVRPTELGSVMPPMQLGDSAQESLEIWRNLPPLYWATQLPQPKPGARVLAETPDRTGADGRPLPLILLQYVGSGKVLFHASDETWRWRYRVGDVFFSRYWVQTIRYLCRSKLTEGDRAVVISSDRQEYQQGEAVMLRVRFVDERLAPAADDGVTVIVEHPGHRSRKITLHRTAASHGLFEALVSGLAAGPHHAWLAVPAAEGEAPATDFTVIPPPGEFQRVRMDAAELERAAQRTGGHFYTFLTAHRLLGDLPPGRQVPLESMPPKPLWNRWPVLLLFLLLLVGEWILRKVGGMV